MPNKPLARWCKNLLPKDYKRRSGEIAAVQQFLSDTLPSPANEQVLVLNVTEQEVVVAVPSAQMTNYLRLYSAEIKQQINESFNNQCSLIFKTMPTAVFDVGRSQSKVSSKTYSHETVKGIENQADWIDDPALQKALKSLARHLPQGK